ncbi:MAG TPA: EscU/YscU/HrcU family type III secretion system export apparatus switch protein [Spirochaetota bacterium]|nr:EscU/YscU/HrcU family type III secretion system export apparatus switch protein [Spirochaetota bacterium]
MKKKAASVTYLKGDMEIPTISSLGEGEVAQRIIEKAKENGIKIVENPSFFEFQKALKVGKPIPKEVYDIVVEILISIIKTNE